MKAVKKVWRTLIILGIILGLVISFVMQVWIKPDIVNPIGRVLGYFDYFTQWSNIFVLVWFINDTFLDNRIKLFNKRGVRGALTVYILVAAAVFWLILNAQWKQVGWDKFETCILHGFTPLMFVLDWLFFYPKGTYRYKQIFKWEIWPIAYMIFAIGMGKITGYFPYSFFNIDKQTPMQFIGSMKYVVLAFILFPIIIVTVDKILYALNKLRGKQLNLSFLEGYDEEVAI
ncbi:MAG: Pr6Pr family membrane protein [Clostridium sp.]|uniref:Pr6Pr family membrane protein n=1 Tax=Clostridium sp. TaxID=1506 RepID=UPI003EE7B92F